MKTEKEYTVVLGVKGKEPTYENEGEIMKAQGEEHKGIQYVHPQLPPALWSYVSQCCIQIPFCLSRSDSN